MHMSNLLSKTQETTH